MRPTVLPFEKLLESAGRSAERAATIFRLWILTAGTLGRSKYYDPIEHYWEHLRYLQHGQLFSFVCEVHSLLAGSKGSLTLNALCRAARAEGFDTTETEIIQAEAHPMAEKLGILRHNACAHRSASLDYDTVFELAGITPAELGAAAIAPLRGVNALLRADGQPIRQPNDLAEKTYAAMLVTLGEA